jgi:hypothetical protein
MPTPDIARELRTATPVDYDPKGWTAQTCNLVNRAADAFDRLTQDRADLVEALRGCVEYMASVEGKGEGGTAAFDAPMGIALETLSRIPGDDPGGEG